MVCWPSLQCTINTQQFYHRREQPGSDFNIDYCVQWLVQLQGCVASKVITAWEQRHLLTSVKQLSGQTPTSQQKQRWPRESVILENHLRLIGSDLILHRLSASGSHWYTVNHRQREKSTFTNLLHMGREHNYIPDAQAWWFMDESLAPRVSKGDLLQQQQQLQVIYSIPEFAIYFFPFNHLRWQDLFKQ